MFASVQPKTNMTITKVQCQHNQSFRAISVIFDDQTNRMNPNEQEHFSTINPIDDKLTDRRKVVENYQHKHMTNHDESNYKFVKSLRLVIDQYRDGFVDDQRMDQTRKK